MEFVNLVDWDCRGEKLPCYIIMKYKSTLYKVLAFAVILQWNIGHCTKEF